MHVAVFLTRVSKRRWIVVAISIVLIAMIGFLVSVIKNETWPLGSDEDQSASNSGRAANFQREALEINKTYSGYVSLFELTLVDYKSSLSDELKNALEEISKSAKRDFPKEFNQSDFIIPCFDESACNPDNTTVADLISAIKESSVDTHLKDAVIKDFVSLVSYKDLDDSKEIHYYNQAFIDTVSVLDAVGPFDPLKNALLEFEKHISQKFPDNYSLHKERNVYRLTNKNVDDQ